MIQDDVIEDTSNCTPELYNGLPCRLYSNVKLRTPALSYSCSRITCGRCGCFCYL